MSPLQPQQDPGELDPEQLAAAGFLLRLSARPLIIAGAGAVAAGAQSALAELAELVGSPVLTTAKGRLAFPADHPLAAGLFGVAASERLLGDSDMVLVVGTSFASLQEGRTPDLPAQMIHVDIDPAQINRVYPVRNGIVGDASAALEWLIQAFGTAPNIQALTDARAAQGPLRAAQARAAAAEPA
ncbi:MAG: hypothetical protein ACT4OM_06440 [Actinomycetota bacterium]